MELCAPRLLTCPLLIARCMLRGSLMSLPAIMRKGLVGLRHAVYVFLLLDRLVAALLLKLLHGLIENALRGALLAIPHQVADKLVGQSRSVDRVRHRLALRNMAFSWHSASPLPAARLN